MDSAICYHRRKYYKCVHSLHYAALLSLLLFCQSVMVDEFCCLLPAQHLYADCLCLIEPDCHYVNCNDEFWVKVRVFRAHSLSFEIYIQFLIRSVWQKYFKIRALILFRNKGWKRPWNRENCCRWNWCCPPDIDALHWYWCRWTDADTLMLLFCCLLLWTRTHIPLQRKTFKVDLLCATHLWKSTSEMHNVQIAQWIFSPTFIHFQPLSSALVCFRSP